MTRRHERSLGTLVAVFILSIAAYAACVAYYLESTP